MDNGFVRLAHNKVGRVPISIISAEIMRVDAGIRMGLLQELFDFSGAAIRYVDTLANPEQIAHFKRVLLGAEGGSEEAALGLRL